MRVITVRYGQTIFDIALQYYGSVEGIEFLIQDNDLTLDVPLEVGQNLNIRNEVKNSTIVKELVNSTPVTNG